MIEPYNLSAIQFAMANMGPLFGMAAPQARVPSEILDFEGRVLARAGPSEEQLVTARLDIEAQRRRRQKARRHFLAEVQAPLHGWIYASAQLFPVNGFDAAPIRDMAENRALERDTNDRMTRSGVLAAPDGAQPEAEGRIH